MCTILYILLSQIFAAKNISELLQKKPKYEHACANKDEVGFQNSVNIHWDIYLLGQ